MNKMSLIRQIGAGANTLTSINQGGGDALQGTPPTPSRVALARYVQKRANGGVSRHWVFCHNQLGGVGRGRGQFGPGKRGGVSQTCAAEAAASREMYPMLAPVLSRHNSLTGTLLHRECLSPSAPVHIVATSEGKKLAFNGSNTYDDSKVYALGVGKYVLKNISCEHPIAIITDSDNLFMYGDASNRRTGIFAGLTTYYYCGDVTIEVTGDFEKASAHCLNHGFMGGQHILRFHEACS